MTKLYAGLDTGQRKTWICVVDSDGSEVFSQAVETDPGLIHRTLKPFRRKLVSVGHETGRNAPSLHRALTRLRLPMVCLDALKVRAALAAQRNKTDRNDARGIAIMLARGIRAAVHMKSLEAERMRSCLAFRVQLVRRRQDIEKSLAAILANHEAELRPGRVIGVRWRKGSKNHELEAAVEAMLRCRSVLHDEARKIETLIEKMAHQDSACRLMMTVPGVGPITSLSVRAAIDDPTRFKDSYSVAAYFGLTTRRFQSGKIDISGRISKFGDPLVRKNLFIAAGSILSTCKGDFDLRTWGMRLKERRGRKRAQIAIARKLAAVLHSIWLSGRPFQAHSKSAKWGRRDRDHEELTS